MKLVSPESLAEPHRSILAGYSRFFPAGAVCVNVIIGTEPWDLRPLLLSLGKVTLARFSMTLTESMARTVASDLEGFSVLCTSQQRCQLLPGEGRFMLLRPYFADTLKDDIERGQIGRVEDRLLIVQSLIKRLSELARRSIAHGHICPANLVREGGQIVLIDPVVGALHQTSDNYLAPETALGKAPEISADLYGLGRTIAILLADAMTPRQRDLIDQLLLPSPRQRPPLEEVALAFGVGAEGGSRQLTDADSRINTTQVKAGRVLRPAESSTPTTSSPTTSSDATETQAVRPVSRSSSLVGTLAILALLLGMAVWIMKDRYPALYFEVTSRLPLLAAQHSAEYESEWASRDRTRMAVVGRAGLIRREPAAINTIVNDLIAGANPEGVRATLLRVALADSWREELKPSDKHAALVFALENLVPEGRAQVASITDLHPGVILALLGQAPVTAIPADLLQLPVETLIRLPAPFGKLFGQLKAMGVARLGEPTALGLAAIVTGNGSPRAFDAFLGKDTQAAQILAKVSLILPVVSTSDAAAHDLLGVLGDLGGDVTTLVRWFDLSDLAGWAGVRPADKLSLILGSLPEAQLGIAQLGDLLTFPLDRIRGLAGEKLRDALRGQDAERLLLTLSTPTNGLTRDQTVALLSALALSPESRVPFVTAWFNLQPASDAVLLLLLSRSSSDAQDVFNLEAARYLRRTEWGANSDILKLLADHPEPLARVLAYGRLDPSVDVDRSVLLERQGREKDQTCLKVLKDRLQSFTKSSER